MSGETSINSATCPEDANSTDCLLRLVLAALDKQAADAAEEYNWDPITFAFTASIGILAALLAILTIYQAVLASGPGRRKSNRRAIGPWALKTKTEWSWRDLNSVSIATTPVLRADDVLRKLGGMDDWMYFLPEKEYSKRELPSHVEDESLERLVRQAQAVDQETQKQEKMTTSGTYSATWLQLLEHIQLHRITLDTTLVEETMADYLPSDLLAVSAYAEVGFLVAAAAAAEWCALVDHHFRSLFPLYLSSHGRTGVSTRLPPTSNLGDSRGILPIWTAFSPLLRRARERFRGE
ncbi:hypothetical protein B0T21DRAFT_135979 [Apiosordaria backusii]|uniref:Uncharacterized protein n=1 Tax=Apiosordaria backusii TaxID=314023 RepID=A0AA40BRN9_9PEZI|nr:hypothetical protein B0T21DRAFT_135979 [Apiosordaria backusii]